MVNKKRQNDPQDDESTAESCDEKQSNSLNSNSTNTCSHINTAVDIGKLRKALKKGGIKKDNCSECAKLTSENNKFTDDAFEYDKTLWLCLKCGSQLCGRSKNGHALKHFKVPRSDCHALALNTTTFNVWCYECDNEVNTSNHKILTCLQYLESQIPNEPEILAPSIPLPPPPSLAPLTLPPQVISLFDKKENLNSTATDMKGDSPPAPPPLPPLTNNVNHQSALPSIPGMAKRVQPIIDSLPSVRGLSNLGNTCFFNAVLQCLAQTPFLLEVLKEALEPGEEFVLPGGKAQIKDENVELPPIKGKLEGLGGLSTALVETLEALQMGGFVYSPDKLLNKFTSKCPQFKGYDQHDSHECLRQLLESVRCEDLNRYKKVILNNLGYTSQKHETVSDELKQKCKFYGGQAADRILRPEPVFRGFLVSTLQCQDCFHTSSCHESFLDISLPISVEKPQPPARRKSSPETSPTATSAGASSSSAATSAGPSKHQLKKEKEKERKMKRAAKHHNKRMALQQQQNATTVGPDGDSIQKNSTVQKDDENLSNNSQSSSSSSSEQSDADVEDNLLDDAPKIGYNGGERCAQVQANRNALPPPYSSLSHLYDSNGNNELSSPVNVEKRGDSPENPNKEDSNDDENDSGIATSPANTTIIEQEVKGGFSQRNHEENAAIAASNVVLELGISEQGATLVMQRSLSQGSNGNAADVSSVSGTGFPPPIPPLDELEKLTLDDDSDIIAAKRKALKKKRVRTQSHSDWCTTIAPRYQCEDGECSIQSCLNNFTAVELMTGNNKVGCDECTKHINGENGKKIYKNATKQFLISSPPAVLILHLKRFQVGPRCMFRKLSKPVTFPMILDIAPFCGSKIKNLPNVNRKQKKLLYALYGVVEHSGGMYGGHYTAFVKVRPKLSTDDPRWKFLPKGSKAELDQTDEQLAKLQELKEKADAREKARQLRISENDSDDASSLSSSSTNSISDNVLEQQLDETEGAVGGSLSATNDECPDASIQSPPPGKWYYVSDSRVQQADEEAVLKAQAYLLFYERIY